MSNKIEKTRKGKWFQKRIQTIIMIKEVPSVKVIGWESTGKNKRNPILTFDTKTVIRKKDIIHRVLPNT